MTISKENHITLLKDILSTHCQDCSGSSSQYAQASRIVDNLLVEFGQEEDIKKVLSEIQNYCKQGTQLSYHTDHINENQTAISKWVEHLHSMNS
ncbi:MAG: hypothetical protein K0R71_944 [Bacillales bacterium]|jgi:uncharacterized membrane protein|nr:hypothetical protein [Bacillales bacterium]